MSQCEASTYRESYNPPTPAEYCENEAEPEFDYCLEHIYLDPSSLDDDDRSDDDWPFR